MSGPPGYRQDGLKEVAFAVSVVAFCRTSQFPTLPILGLPRSMESLLFSNLSLPSTPKSRKFPLRSVYNSQYQPA